MQLSDIVLYWFLFVSIASAVGAFTGTLLALGVSKLFKKWTDK